MIKLTPDEAERVLVVELHGMVSEEDYDQAAEQLEQKYPQFSVRLRGGTGGGIGMLLDYGALEGWEKGAKTLGTISGKMIGDVVRRLALVADDRWKDEKQRIADINPKGEVRMFKPSERAQALSWLTGG
jgi:hypothetical protein